MAGRRTRSRNSKKSFEPEELPEIEEPDDVSRGGLFFVTGGAGGGVYSLGTLLNAELGIEIPFGERLLGGVSLVMSNQHQSGSKDALMSSTNRPVLYDASNVFNTLNGSIEYALTYQF